MDYKAWSQCEAVPLSNGIIARRSGLHYLKSPEEIRDYYFQNFGTYWFNELPKTDNTYNRTSQFYGCTLAPGIPLIPNLCRRPLRSPDHAYAYNFASAHHHQTSEVTHNHYTNNNHGNGNGMSPVSHLGLTRLSRRHVDLQDSGLESDSELELEDNEIPKSYVRSQNKVTLLSWLVTVVTTVITSIITVVTNTIYRGREHQNHVSTRVPLKPAEGVSWYQYPVLWLYKLALLMHQADIWLLYKVNSLIKLDNWGKPEQRRKWALILLLIPLVIWAGYKLWEWWSEENPSSSDSLLSSILPLWGLISSWISDLWGWFDGGWLWAPWTALVAWLETSEDTFSEEQSVEYSTDNTSDVDYVSMLTWPFTRLAPFFASAGAYLETAAFYIGDKAVVFSTDIGSYLLAAVTWLMDCLLAVPALLSSALAFIVYPFKSIRWEYGVSDDYATPPPPTMNMAGSPDSEANLDQVLGDRRALAGLVTYLLASEEFSRALDQRQADLALHKIHQEFSKVRKELNDRISTDESSVETKMDALKQQIEELQMALLAHKTLVSEQASIGNKLEARVTSAERLQLQEEEEHAKLKEQILIEVAKVREEITGQLMNIQLNQKVVTESDTVTSVPNPKDLEAFVNSTVERLLAIYDADKIGKVDYALASSGGSVLSVRCTETFSKKNAQYYMWGYPLWSKAANDPRVALEPAINPGECWAFSGNRGYMLIELSENITVTAFTLEHLPRSLSHTGTIDTAPRDFHVLGLESKEDDTPILLGQFRYEDNGISLQHFQALVVNYAFKIVELVIESNHGNLEYTCLYRFRVHGRPARLS